MLAFHFLLIWVPFKSKMHHWAASHQWNAYWQSHGHFICVFQSTSHVRLVSPLQVGQFVRALARALLCLVVHFFFQFFLAVPWWKKVKYACWKAFTIIFTILPLGVTLLCCARRGRWLWKWWCLAPDRGQSTSGLFPNTGTCIIHSFDWAMIVAQSISSLPSNASQWPLPLPLLFVHWRCPYGSVEVVCVAYYLLP